MQKIIFLLTGFLLWQFSLQAQSYPKWDAAKIKQQLEKLNVLGRVLYVAAHPDDENTHLLAYLSNGKKYRTAYLALTRGDGGQNLVGDEQGAYLGLIRTQELLAARKIDGAEQFFSSAVDFGFSKTAKETFDFWGHQRILSDVVWIVRKFRPDVIICRFPEDKRAGHGNHWASAVLAHEAFIAAADSTKFAGQLKYVNTWQAKRILWNTYHFGGMNTTSSDQLKINVGGYNPLLGQGYGEIAAESRSMHKSQGFGVSSSYGQDWEYFKTIAGPAPHQTLMDGINTTWSRVSGGERVGALIQKALQQFDMDQPGEIVPLLFDIRSAIDKIPNKYWRLQKEKQINRLILACSGIWLNAYSDDPYIVAGQSLEVHTETINRSDIPVSLQSINILGENYDLDKQLADNILERGEYKITIPENTPISQPYWLRRKHPTGYYIIPGQNLVGLPESPPALTAQFNLKINDETLPVTRPIKYKYTDPVRGEVQDPLIIAPPVTANIANSVYIFTSVEPQQIEVRLKSFKDKVNGTAHLQVPAHFSVQNNDQPFSLAHSGDEKILHFTIMPVREIQSSSGNSLTVHLKVNGKDYDRGIKVIAHNYIPVISVFPLSETKLVSIPLQISGHHIGYIMGAGDKVPQALIQMGYEVKLLSDQDLTAANLKQFDAIVTGVRAYNTRDHLQYVQNRLMDYVKQGGTLVVQYNKSRNLVTQDIGPYPFQISRNRVTDETAAVKFLLPDDPVFNFPNKITEKDFEDWIQERGLYFVTNVDSHYRQPLAMHDPDEALLDGSLIVCDYGEGKYVYTSLDFFRELPAGVPGAFRLFANLIAK